MANVGNSCNTHLVSCVHWIIATDGGGRIGETCNCIAIDVLLCNHQSKRDNKLISKIFFNRAREKKFLITQNPSAVKSRIFYGIGEYIHP